MPAPPSVDNYTKFQGHGVSIPTTWYSDRYYAQLNNPPQDTANNAELSAWMCNQVDNCKGFMRRRGNNEMWFYDDSQPILHANVPGDTLDTYIKKGTSVRKVDNPDTSDPSILSNPVTKVIFNNASDGFNATYGSHSYVSYDANNMFSKKIPNRADFNGYNNIGAVTVPLGWRFLDGDNGWASGQGGCCHNSILTGDGTKANSWGNYNDGVLVENRGFDVPSNWDTMESKGVDPGDAKRIRFKWCNQSMTNIQTQQCQNFMSLPANGYDYNVSYLALCAQQPNWQKLPNCLSEVNSVLKTPLNNASAAASVQSAVSMVKTFCDANPTDPLCACYNVTNNSNNCLGAQKGLPGCKGLNDTLGTLPADAQVSFSDRFCASVDCQNAVSGNGVLIPSQRDPSKTCPVIQQCVNDLRGAQFNNSQMSASCQQTLTITVPTPPPAPKAAPAPTPKASPTATPKATPTATPTKASPAATPSSSPSPVSAIPQAAVIGGGFLTLLSSCAVVFCIIIIIMFMMK